MSDKDIDISDEPCTCGSKVAYTGGFIDEDGCIVYAWKCKQCDKVLIC